jgi:hypothetical protein
LGGLISLTAAGEEACSDLGLGASDFSDSDESIESSF